MKKISRLLALLLAVSMVFTVAGCGKQSTESSPDSSDAAVQGGEGFDIDNIDATQGGTSGGSSGGSSGSSGNVSKGDGTGGTITNTGVNYDNVMNIDTDDNKYPGRATNLKGKTIRCQFWQPYMSGTGNDVTDYPLLSSRFKELCKEIGEKLNCKIEMVEGWSNESGPQINASVASGKPSVDIWWVPTSMLDSAYRNGYLTDLSALKVFDFQDRSRFSHATEMCNINGSYYGVAPRTYGKIPIFTNTILYANVDLLEDVGVPLSDLIKWQENKEWTWSKFREVCQKVKDNNGKNGYSTYSVNDCNTDFYQCLMIANGTDWVERDAKDTTKFTFTGGSQAGQNVLKFYSQLYKDGFLSFNEDRDQGTEFKNNQVAFYGGSMSKLTTEAGHWKINFAVMYPPIGDDVNDYVTAGRQYSFACIPKGKKPSGCTDAEIATVLNLINTGLLSKEEDASQLYSDLSFSIKNQLTNKTCMSLYNQPQKIAWSMLTYGVGLSTNDGRGGWNGEVHKIAEAGGANIASVLNQVTPGYNAKLAGMYKK